MVTVKQKIIPVETIKWSHHIQLGCHLDSNHQPIIIYKEKKYTSMHDLCMELPEFLSGTIDLKKLAHFLNFMSKGIGYEVIDNIKRYKEDYLARIEFEKNSFDYLPVRLRDHGVFDVSVMHSPQIVREEFIFFVKNADNNVPYRVNCPFPINPETPNLNYQLLPYTTG